MENRDNEETDLQEVIAKAQRSLDPVLDPSARDWDITEEEILLRKWRSVFERLELTIRLLGGELGSKNTCRASLEALQRDARTAHQVIGLLEKRVETNHKRVEAEENKRDA